MLQELVEQLRRTADTGEGIECYIFAHLPCSRRAALQYAEYASSAVLKSPKLYPIP